MEASPLTQQARPETFQPKVVQLYETLFQACALPTNLAEPTEGFWREFFLLPPDPVHLRRIIDAFTPDDALSLQAITQQVFSRAIREAAAGVAPNDTHALETLTAFLGSILVKKYTNPSSDIITILAGLNEGDQVFTDFVGILDRIIRTGSYFDLRLQAVRTAIAIVSGAYKTGLVSYFTHRDLFPSIMKFIHDSEDHLKILEPFSLLGLLANYNKFEFQNPYQQRLGDFVNESTIQKIVKSTGLSCAGLRNGYVAIEDDLPEGWTLSNTLVFFGLRALTGGAKDKTVTLNPEEIKETFAAQPAAEATILLATYDFVNANKLFGYSLVTSVPEKRNEESPFSSFLSLTSYLLQHAYRSERVATYAELNLSILRILVEDPVLCKRICGEEGRRNVRLCRQRQPHIPLVNGERVPATVIFDIMIDTMTHNLRRRLDVNLYCHTIGILIRLFTFLSSNRTRLTYHWSELWRTLLSLMRFLTTYASDISLNPRINNLTTSLVNLIAFSLSAGDTFLPDPASYDDLFYKIVETGPVIARFRDVYNLAPFACTTPGSKETNNTDISDTNIAAIDILISVSTHFHSLLFQTDKSDSTNGATDSNDAPKIIPAARKKNLGPREVHQIIKQGSDTLSIQTREGLNTWSKWREADSKLELKRAARCAVEDARKLVLQ
ncbi:hypothetical protein BGW36DRAFT_397344 [Talaromyces proteolyticus]|uniref:Armadillo-like helical domain-containing protein n=1 Tax=Talaromyces proteolyticus TaxID=1131652 RepID=A0AAD4KRK4_9EURO|nr:uncharacterized protein BGW36DRAFT_397344 [Talaromyces proteolyticus]KAH8697684.1 hypothetical protein BGW36DRAFT_397344 [Talaromyces proteolyticus]